MIGKYILDSSIWIEIERSNPQICQKVVPLIQNNEIAQIDIIVAEVLRGVKTKRDYEALKKEFQSFEILKTNWLRVAEFAFEVSRRGFNPPLADLYIASCVKDHQRILLTQDRDFIDIQRVKNFQVELI